MRARLREAMVVAVIAGIAASPVPLNGWAMDVHRLLTARAVDGLPDALRPFFQAEREFIAEHSVDPDLWRTLDLRDALGKESPNHFLDIDFEDGSAPPFLNVPRTYDDYLQTYGAARVARYGRLPWRAEELFDRMVATFEDVGRSGAPSASNDLRYIMAVLAHYIEDAHVPFHGTRNFDGQLTGQRGIHARFERDLVLRNRDDWKWQSVRVSDISNFRAFMFETIIESQQLVAPVLEADRRAASGLTRYDAAYFNDFTDGAGAIAEKRMNDAVAAVASAVHSAWLKAGRPRLPGGSNHRRP